MSTGSTTSPRPPEPNPTSTKGCCSSTSAATARTGHRPRYAGGAESKQWSWVHDREEGPSPADNATRLLIESIVIVGEVWATVAVDPTVRPAAQLVPTLLRLEQALRTVEPWELFTVATAVAAHAPDSARQQIALRLAQLAHAGDVDVPEHLVAAIVG